MIVINKAKAAWSEQRTCWRLDIQYNDPEGASKRTFIVVPNAEPSKAGGAVAAEKAAKDFRRAIGPLYAGFYAKFDAARPKPAAKPLPSPVKVRKGVRTTVDWLLNECLTHPEIWGSVKHPVNYVSGVKKLTAVVGDRQVSEFEPPHGRKLVMEVVNTLRGEGHSDGYVRKIAYQLRQALGAAIGQGISEPILDPNTGDQLINDVPTFPPLPKSKGRTAVLEKDQDQVVFEVIAKRFETAREEERAWGIKHGKEHLLGIGAVGRVEVDGEVRWLNARRFTSGQWLNFQHYIRFLIETGCRRSEALSVGNHSVRWRETLDDNGAVIDKRPVLFLPGEVTKNGDDRFINITPALQSYLTIWEATAAPHSFQIGTRTITREKAWFRFNANQVTNMWNLVRADAKRIHHVDLSAVSPHNLRHTHATRMSERGMSGKPLQDHLGHRDAKATAIYDHASQIDNSRKFYARNVSG